MRGSEGSSARPASSPESHGAWACSLLVVRSKRKKIKKFGIQMNYQLHQQLICSAHELFVS